MIRPILFALLLMIGHPQAAASDGTLRVIDDADRVVEIESHATRVAIVAPFGTELMTRLGFEPVAAPRLPDGTTDWPEEWTSAVPLRISHASGPSLEQLAACSPDLVISTSAYAHTHDTIERSLGVPVVTMDIVGLDDLSRHLETLGVLLGREDEAASAARAYRETLDAALEGVDATRDGAAPRVLAIFGGARSFYGFLPESYVGSVLDALGCELTTSGLEAHSIYSNLTPLSLEHAVTADPDLVLVLGHGGSSQTAETILKDRAWASLRAVREGRVVGLPDDLFVIRPGTEPARAIAAARDAVESD